MARPYLWPLMGASTLAGAPPSAGPGALTGEAIGVGEVRLSTLDDAPVAVVLCDRSQSEAAAPVGDALNEVLVVHGGNRVSAVDLSDLWAVARAPARVVLRKVVDDAVVKITAGYAAQGRPVPANLATERAWLVADWEGTWKPALARNCAGLAVAFLDRGLHPVEVLCDPTAAAAADRYRALLTASAGDPAPPKGDGAGRSGP